MVSRRYIPAATLLLALAVPACTSRDERAGTAASIAADALAQGDIVTARRRIAEALAARDDVGDYWLLAGRIALAEANYPHAFEAFENALTLDRGNVEALTRICQLAVNGRQPTRAERYADQLAALQPGNGVAVNVQAAIAVERGDKAQAVQLLDQILAGDPTDTAALITRSRLLSAGGDYRGAARAAEASLAVPGDPTGRLVVLKEAYRKAGDADGWRRTVARMARAAPRSVPAQLDYVRSLYDAGDAPGGLAVARRLLEGRPGDVAVADRVLNLWRAQGNKAMPARAIVASAAGASIENKAALAAYANAIGRPDLALQALGDVGAAEPAGTATNNAKVARAQAQALFGRRDAATAGVAAVLNADPDHPRALAVRGWLRAKAGDTRGAVGDLRHALAADGANADARLALAELQLAGGDSVLAARTIGDGLNEAGADPRLAARLAALLRSRNRTAEASAVLTTYRRENPFARQPTG